METLGNRRNNAMKSPDKTDTLPAGTYVISDPGYVLCRSKPGTVWNPEEKDDWSQLLEDTGCFGGCDAEGKWKPRAEQFGIFQFRGENFGASSTAHGDGGYRDQFGNVYGVDAGCIAVIPVGILDKDVSAQDHTVIEFEEPFTINFDGKTIRFGHIEIQTG